MEQLTINWTLVTLALCGMVIGLFGPVTRKTKGGKFSLKVFLTDASNWKGIFVSLASIVAMVVMADKISNAMGMDAEGFGMYFVAFASGHSPHHMTRWVLKMVKSKADE